MRVDNRRRGRQGALAASLLASCGLACSVLAQGSGGLGASGRVLATRVMAQPAGDGAAAQPSAPAAPSRTEASIRFSFKDAPFAQVVDFFARESGLPVIQEVEPPKGGMTFISDRAYTFEEALSILNLNLLPRGQQLRRTADFLYLGTLKDSARKAAEVVRGAVPDAVRPEQIVNLTIALQNAQADRVAEQIKPLVAEYGSVTAVPAQNMLIVVESAAQCRRIADIVSAIDTVRPVDSAYRLFPLRHAQAEPVFSALKGLLGERTRQVFIDKDGKQTVVQDVAVTGLNLQPDPRTNSIIAVGSEARIKVVQELVTMLDVPDPSSQRGLTATFLLESVRPERAAEKLAALFAPLEAAKRPTIVPLGEASKLLIVGSSETLTQARALLRELDPGARESGADAAAAVESPRRTAVVKLTYITPAAVERLVPRLLNQRQQGAVRLAPTPDERGVVVIGPEAEVKALEALIASVDVAPDAPREVRQVRVDRGDPAQILERARGLYAMTGREKAEPVQAVLAPDGRSINLIGARGGIDRFAELIAGAQEASPPPDRSTVSVLPLKSADAGEVAGSVEAVIRPKPGEEPPAVRVDRAGNALLVRATPEQIKAIEELAAKLDAASAQSGRQVRVLNVDRARLEAEMLAQTLRTLSERQGGVRVKVVPASELLKSPGTEKPSQPVKPDAPAAPEKPQGMLPGRGVDRALAMAMLGAAMAAIDEPAAPAGAEAEEVTIGVDPATNALVIVGPRRAAERLAALAEEIQRQAPAEPTRVRLMELPASADPQALANVIRQTVDRLGRASAQNPGGFTGAVAVTPDPSGGALVLWANDTDYEPIAELVRSLLSLDGGAARSLPIRYVKLERADAQAVAAALNKFFQDRAAASTLGGRRIVPRVAITGERRSGMLIVAAPDEEYAQVEKLAATFDTPGTSKEMQFRVLTLKNARVADLGRTIESLSWDLQWDRQSGRWYGAAEDEGDKLFVQTNESLNAVILIGQGKVLDSMSRIVSELDRPAATQDQVSVKSVQVARGDLNRIAELVRQATATPGWSWWRGRDPEAVMVEVDQSRRTLMLIGKQARIAEAERFIADAMGKAPETLPSQEAMALKHAPAQRLADTIRRAINERAASGGKPADALSIIASPDGNTLLVTGVDEDRAAVRELVATLDQPEVGKDRTTEIVMLQNRDAAELAGVVRAQFPAARVESQVIVTPQPGANALVLSARPTEMALARDLLKQLDALPTADAARLVSIPLQHARAEEIAQALRAALPTGLKLGVTPVRRTNTLLLTGSEQTIALAKEQIAKIDVAQERPVVDFRRTALKHAIASDVAFTLNEMLQSRPPGQPGEPRPSVDWNPRDNTLSFSGTPDQIRDIQSMIDQLDQPVEAARKVEFVKLAFAKADQTANALGVFYGRFAREARTPAARAVSIVADPASNSLVIAADESEWTGLRSLLAKLDTEDYDTARQLAVIPLKHADAGSVARAINEGFRAPVQERLVREQARRQGSRTGRDDEPMLPTVLVDSEPTPSVSAETQTNSLVVFAGRKDLERIRSLVGQIDVPEFQKLPEARVIPVRRGQASRLAQSVREVFVGRGGNARSLAIVGDDAAGALIVRAEQKDLEQIRALAETLQQQGEQARAGVRVLPLKHVQASRLQRTIQQTFGAAARDQNESLTVEIDRTSNALVIASSQRLFEEIERVVAQLDRGDERAGGDVPEVGPPKPEAAGADPLPTPGPGQGVTVVDVRNNAPEDVRQLLEQLGVTQPPRDDRPGLVGEPVTLVPMKTRRALAVVATPGDARTIAELVRQLDADPIQPEQHVLAVGLRLASSPAIVQTLRAMLSVQDPGQDRAGQTGPARALAEHIRRLSVAPNGLGQKDLTIDLAQPIRLIADVQTNTVVIASTRANAEAIREVVRTLDALPIGDAVVVRLFPLSNASASRMRSIVEELFRRGDALRRLPGTQRLGEPSTTAGKALAGDIAITVDDRTNTLVVAGREESVAFVEVMLRELDSEQASKWIEPTIITLKHADPVRLRDTLRRVLTEAASTSPELVGLQRQFGRLRVLRQGKELKDPAARIEADLFAPITGLVIEPESTLNALIVVGSPANVQAVKELAAQLDVEAAAASNTVRTYPLVHAAADRVAQIVGDLFRQRQQDPSTRPEDRVIVNADLRTNALVVSTSPRSFGVLEPLLKTLDRETVDFSVGLHLIAVEGASATILAPKIDRLMGDRLAAARRGGEPASPSDFFRVESDATGNLLIVAASDENLKLVQELVDQLSKQSQTRSEGTRTDLIPLKSGRAADVAATIRQLYADKENAARGPRAVDIVSNDRANALVVSGTEQDMREIRALLDRLEGAEVTSSQDIRRIGLKSATALEVTQLLQSVLAGRAVSGGSDVAARQATKLRFFRERVAGAIGKGDAVSEAQIDSAIREQVSVTPELRTNSVMVKAPTEVMGLIQQMIEDLDTTSAGARKIEQFRLKNADVRQMAELLRDVFTLRQRGSSYVLVPTEVPTTPGGEGPTPLLDGSTRSALTPVPDDRQELSIAIDARTNTLIVSGTEEYLRRVREVVEQIDGLEASERVQRVYAVRNTKAKEIETTLAAYFRGESTLQRQLLGPDQAGSAMRRLEQEVTVVGDEKSNKLVISTSPRYMQMVLDMVRELDAAPPQVIIQVLLAEVTVDSRSQWGMDFRIKNFGGDAYNFGFLSAGSGVASALGVPNISFSSADFELVLRALEAQGRLQVLSSPHLTARNNERASINVGQNIAIVQGTERTPQGSIRADVTREDVGIKLAVTPSVSPDGFVRLEIEPEISTLASQTTEISEDFRAPIINKRQLNTTVTVKDGQTVVLGGLIQTQNDQRRSKVPGVGDIPVIGWAFRSRDVADTKTELLVILTPRVIYNDQPEGPDAFTRYSDQRIDDLENPRRIRDGLESSGMRALEREPRPLQPPVPPEPEAPAPTPPPSRDGRPYDQTTFSPSRDGQRPPTTTPDKEKDKDKPKDPVWNW